MSEIFSNIQTLLEKNMFLSKEKKVHVLQKLPQASLEKQKRVLVLLQKAEQDQQIVLREIVKKNPHFLGEVNHEVSHKKQGNLHLREVKDRREESHILEELEDELETL